MKKGVLVSILLLCISALIYSVSASTYVISQEYNDNTSCQNDVTRYNSEFPDYIRTSCFSSNWKYYYKICQKWDTCIDSNANTTNSQNVTSIQNNYQSWATNNYTSTLSSTLKTKIDQKIITVLKNAKNKYSKNEFKIILTNFLTKLNELKTKYSSNSTIKNIVWYIEFEVGKILFELEEDNVDDFICELMWNCNTTNTNKILSITINQWIFYCWDPSKNDYTTYSPVNKIVLLDNDIITRCTTKGWKAWTKSASGTIENLKNITDVKDGDVFTTESNSATTNSSPSSPISSSWSSSTTNVCWTWKKKVWNVCVTDTASVNPNGNYSFWNWACVSHIWNDVWYNWSWYTLSINGNTHWIWKTLNQCIEACDIGDINIGPGRASCFYEWKIIRNAGSSTIINITSGTIINTSPANPTSPSTSTGGQSIGVNYWAMISVYRDNTEIRLNYNMLKNYDECGIWLSDSENYYSRSGTWLIATSWSFFSLTSSWAYFNWNRGVWTNENAYLNLYCKNNNQLYRKIIQSTKLKDLIWVPLNTTYISNIPELPTTQSGWVTTNQSWATTINQSTTITPTYTQAQVNAAIEEIIRIHGNTTEAIKAVVSGILSLESQWAIGLREQVANYFWITIDRVNAAITLYR